MVFDDAELRHAFDFDPDTVRTLRTRWISLVERAVWDDLKSRQIGALPRMRKRLFEIGDALRSLVADRSWIPQPRERVKGAMAASLNLRDALLQADRAIATLNGGNDFAAFERDYLAFRQSLLVFMETHEARFGDLLEAQYSEAVDADEDSGARIDDDPGPEKERDNPPETASDPQNQTAGGAP